MRNLVNQVNDIFTENGVLSKELKDYKFRVGQTDMATSVAEAISNQTKVVIEAGTGIGKSYAYLIPAVLSGKRVIVSTATKNLQKQLFDKDLPFVTEFLGVNIKTAILKGVRNYLCHLKLEQEITASSCHSERVLDELLRIKLWSVNTTDGDLDNLSTVSNQSVALEKTRTSLHDCVGKNCDFYQDCFSRKAKNIAEQSNVLITNHHLLFSKAQADFLYGDGVVSEAEVIVFDEAHSLPGIMGVVCGDRISKVQIDGVIEALSDSYNEHIGDSQTFEQALVLMRSSFLNWQECFFNFYSEKVTINTVLSHREHALLLWSWVETCDSLVDVIRSLEGRVVEFDTCISSTLLLIECIVNSLKQQHSNTMNYFDFYGRSISFNTALMSVKEQLNRHFDKGVSCVFTSATLQFKGSLSNFSSQLNLSSYKQIIIESPFNFFEQTMLYVPRIAAGLNERTRNNSNKASNGFIDISCDLIEVNKGRTFVLCTSHNAVQQIASVLSKKLEYPVLVQGQAGKDALLSKYRVLGNAVLVGTYSFWEGVDIKGELLSNIIIEKLPFSSPEEFFTKARAILTVAKGRDPFIETVLPQATLKLKQGIGRLIRHENDRGLITIFDERLVTQEYGQDFLLSIPEMNKTRSHPRAIDFLANK